MYKAEFFHLEFSEYVLSNVDTDKKIEAPTGDSSNVDNFCYVFPDPESLKISKNGFSIVAFKNEQDYFIRFHRNTKWPTHYSDHYFLIKPRATMIVAITLAQHGIKL